MYGMKVCVVTDGGGRLPECDLALFGFNRLGEVDYESELSGRSDKFEAAARLSRARCSAFYYTINRGEKQSNALALSRFVHNLLPPAILRLSSISFSASSSGTSACRRTVIQCVLFM